ncbi:laminin subunit gamma-1-like [Oscarella lobularis]|uniref:laminin subunit gamma-1-like n=1 Tax=Oscarella lobularis TaxID=121494 RepID=UPI00331413F9
MVAMARVLVVALLALFPLVGAQEDPPASFTLLNNILMASSNDTCGSPPEVYFDPVANENRTCDATDDMNDHPPSDALDNDEASWWQSKGGVESVSLYIDLKQVYEVLSVNVRMGNSYLPRDFVLEKRIEDGSYVPLEYVVDDPSNRCLSVFGVNAKESFALSDPANVTLCHGPTDTDLGAGGDTINIDFVLTDLTLRPGAITHTREFVDFISTRMLRLRFIGFVPDAIDDGAEFFTVADLTITGRCSCNGFASTCTEATLANPVYKCDCTPSSLTDGASCDRCQALFNNASYMRAFDDPSFVCQECDCNGEADSCAFDATLARGVCNCTNNTHGIDCGECRVNVERNPVTGACDACKDGFFGLDPNNPNGCDPCVCDDVGAINDICGKEDGQCSCQPNIVGLSCDRCDDRTFNFSPTGCQSCQCADPNAQCNSTTGQCVCPPNVVGLRCDACAPNFFNFSATDGCQPCNCTPGGSINQSCTDDAGLCYCHPGVVGDKCDECDANFFNFTNGIGCEPCECDSEGSRNLQCNATTGVCPCLLNVAGDKCDGGCEPGFFDLQPWPGCRPCNCNNTGSVGIECHQTIGNCTCHPGVAGAKCDGGCEDFFCNFTPNVGCQPCDCDADGSDGTPCDKSTCDCNCLPGVGGARCDACLPGFFNLTAGCENCLCDPTGSVNNSCDSVTGDCACKVGYVSSKCASCDQGFTRATSGACVPCADVCNSHATECDSETRVCVCLNNTFGDQCDVCAPGFFGNATAGLPTDCEECECDLVGSVNGSVCHPINGTCECKVGLVSPCRVCAEGFFNKTNDGCQLCMCDSMGSFNESCDEIGQCACKDGVTGLKCDQCLPFHFGFANCTSCSEGANGFCIAQLESEINGASATIGYVSERFNNHSAEADSLLKMLTDLEADVDAKKENVSDLLLRLQALEMRVENLEMRAEYLLNRTCYLLDKAKALKRRAEQLYNETCDRLPEVEKIRDDAVNVLSTAMSVYMRIDSIATEVEGKRNDSQQLFDMAVATLEGFTTSFDQQNMSVYQAKKMATDALTMAMYIYEKAKNLSLSIDALNASISHLMDLETSVGEETQKTDEVIADVMRVVQMVEERLNMTDDLEKVISGIVAMANSTLDMIEARNDHARSSLEDAKSFYEMANSTLESTQTMLAMLMDRLVGFNNNLLVVEERVDASVSHAYALADQAMLMKMIFEYSRRFGQMAVDIADMYESTETTVAEALALAQMAREKALNASRHVEELGGKALSDQAAAAKSSSEMLLNRANQVLEDVRNFKMHNKTAANETVESARHYFNLAQQANEDVRNAIANLPTFGDLPKDIDEKVDCIREGAGDCADTLDTVDATLDSMKEPNVENAEMTADQANATFTKARQTLSNASATLDDIEEKLNLTKSITADNSVMQQAVKTNISRLKMKLDMLKSVVASQCQGKLVFTQTSAVARFELSNLADDGFNVGNRFVSVSFYFLAQRNHGLLLYLAPRHGDVAAYQYFSLEIVDNYLWLKFSVGGRSGTIRHEQRIHVGEWYHVYATRHYHFGAVTLTDPDGDMSTYYGRAEKRALSTYSNDTCLALFGGLDSSFNKTSSAVNQSDFVGLIHMITIKRQMIAVSDIDFHPRNQTQPCPTRNATSPALFGSYFFENSFLQFMTPSVNETNVANISFRFSTAQASAQLLYVESDDRMTYLAIGIRENSPLIISRCGPTASAQIVLASDVKLTNRQWHTVTVDMKYDGFLCVVDVTVDHSSFQSLSFPTSVDFTQLNEKLYVGGVPDSFSLSGIPQLSLIDGVDDYQGCLRDLTFGSAKRIALPTAVERQNVDFASCPFDRVNGVSFKGKGHGTITGLGGLLENITFDIVTDQKSSVLAYFKNTYGEYFYLAIYNGDLILLEKASGVAHKLSTCNAYVHDGRPHRIMIQFSETTIRIYVDGILVANLASGNGQLRLPSEIYVGGIPEDLFDEAQMAISDVPVAEGYVGCIQNVSVNSELVQFESSLSVNVDFLGCRMPSTVTPPMQSPMCPGPIPKPPPSLPPLPPFPSITPTPAFTSTAPPPSFPPPPPSISITPTTSIVKPTSIPPPSFPPPPPSTSIAPTSVVKQTPPPSFPTPPPPSTAVAPSPTPTVPPTPTEVTPTPTEKETPTPTEKETPTPTAPPEGCAPIMLSDPFIGTRKTLMLQNSYFQFTAPRNVKRTTNIEMSIRTTSFDGILVYLGGSFVDFFGMEIRGGKVRVVFNAGSTNIEAITNSSYNDGQFHKIVVARSDRSVTLTVDSETVSASSPSRRVGIDSDRKFFIGGVAAGSPATGLLTSGEASRPSAISCFANVTLNGRTLDLDNPVDSAGIGVCPGTGGAGAHYDGTGYFSFYTDSSPSVLTSRAWKSGVRFTISLRFRTNNDSGLIFYTFNPIIPDYVLVAFNKGVVDFSFNNGDNEVTIQLDTTTLGVSLCDGKWHSLTLTKDTLIGTITLDSVFEATGSAPNGLSGTDTFAPLYFGGVPNDISRPPPRNLGDISFNGCLDNLFLQSSRTLNPPSYDDPSSVLLGVIEGCPLLP